MKEIAKTLFLFSVLLILASCSGAYHEIFDGNSLEGWQCDPAGLAADWKAEDGILVGENASEEESILWTTKNYSDFAVELDYKTLSDDYDSGLFLRDISHQVQIGISRSLQSDMTACIYAPKDEKGNYPGQTDKVTEVHKLGEWNHLKVEIRGKHILTYLNDELMVDYMAINIPDEGPVGLQLHGGVHMAVQFKNIRLKELRD